MALIDYDEKINETIDFYDHAISAFESVENIVSGFQSKYGFNLMEDEVTPEIVEKHLFDFESSVLGQKKEILKLLGNVGEYALKYLLLLKQIDDYPDQTFNEFKNDEIFLIGKTNSVGNRYINGRYHLPQSVVDSIRNCFSQIALQPLHDYHYLFKVIGILYPREKEEIYQFIKLSIKEHLVLNSNIPENFKRYFSLLPEKIVLHINDLSKEEIDAIRANFDRIIQESGDVFVRIRYIANNDSIPQSEKENGYKKYNIKEIYELMNYFVQYIKIIHEINNDKLTNNILQLVHMDHFIKECNQDIIRNGVMNNGSISRNDYYKLSNDKQIFVKELFALEKFKDDMELIFASVFETNLTLDQLKELDKEDLSREELYALIRSSITVDKVKFLRSKGIVSIESIIKIISNNDFDEFKNYNLSEEDFRLLEYVDINMITSIKKDQKIYGYILNNLSVLKSFFGYYYDKESFDLFNEIISMEEIKSNPELLKQLSKTQLTVLKQLNIKSLSNQEIINNIKDNYNYFKDNTIISKIPIMVNAKNNKEVLEILVNENFDITNLKNLDSTIFCIPAHIIKIILNFMKSNNIHFINEKNEVSKDFYNILESLRKKNTSEYEKTPLPLQHIKCEEDEEDIVYNSYKEPNPIDLNIHTYK